MEQQCDSLFTLKHLRKRLPEDLLVCLDFRPNPYFAAADEQQDDGFGAVRLDYEDGSKAQWTEEEILRWRIKREIENILWPESSTVPKEKCAVGQPELIFVPWTMPVYKMTTGMQEDPIHQDTVFRN